MRRKDTLGRRNCVAARTGSREAVDRRLCDRAVTSVLVFVLILIRIRQRRGLRPRSVRCMDTGTGMIRRWPSQPDAARADDQADDAPLPDDVILAIATRVADVDAELLRRLAE